MKKRWENWHIDLTKNKKMSSLAKSSLSLCPLGGGWPLSRDSQIPSSSPKWKRTKETKQAFEYMALSWCVCFRKLKGWILLINPSLLFTLCRQPVVLSKEYQYFYKTLPRYFQNLQYVSRSTIFQYKSHSHYSNNPPPNANTSHFKLQLF